MTINALELSGVTKIYKDGFKAVDNISFEVKQGDFFALLGPNGAGKSTTLGMISALVNKTSGQIKVFGHDTESDYQQARKLLGVMPQEINLNIFETPMQILCNQAGFFGIPRSIAKPYAEELLTKMSLFDKRNTQVRFLSGGMKRRVMVARALIHKPKLLILDEPTAGVDVELRQSLWEMMCEFNRQGLTIILTTHYLEEAESMCNRIALIHQGTVHVSGLMRDFLRTANKEHYIVDLKSPIEDKAIDLNIGTVTYIDPLTVEIEVDKSIVLNDIFTALSAQNLQVLSIRTKTAKLEQLFIDIAKNKTAK